MTNQLDDSPNRPNKFSSLKNGGLLIAATGFAVGAASGSLIGGCTYGFFGYWGPMGLE